MPLERAYETESNDPFPASLPGDLAMDFGETVTNWQHSNAQFFLDIFNNDFLILSLYSFFHNGCQLQRVLLLLC